MKELLEYAQKRLAEACDQREDVCSLRYWVGYIDGIKAAMREAER